MVDRVRADFVPSGFINGVWVQCGDGSISVAPARALPLRSPVRPGVENALGVLACEPFKRQRAEAYASGGDRSCSRPSPSRARGRAGGSNHLEHER